MIVGVEITSSPRLGGNNENHTVYDVVVIFIFHACTTLTATPDVGDCIDITRVAHCVALTTGMA